MPSPDSPSPVIREDRFELASILRTFQKQRQNLSLVRLDDPQTVFTFVRMEASRIRVECVVDVSECSSTLILVAEGNEAKIIFNVDNITWLETNGLKQALGDLSPTFSYIQRRINLRVPVPVWKKFNLSVRLPGYVDHQTFVVHNFSTGGIGLFSIGQPNPQIKPGAIFKKVQLDLGEYGEFKVNVEVISLAEIEEITADSGLFTHRLSMRFLNLSLITQRDFNKIAYAFEVNFNRKR